MNKFFLYLIMLPSKLWQSFGADTTQLRALLHVKLLLDDRKPKGFGRKSRTKKNAKGGLIFSILTGLALGSYYMIPLISYKDKMFGLWLYFSIFLLMLTFSLVADFSTILFDTRDRYIVLPCPVNERTLLLSRLLHIFIYLVRIVLPMSLPGWVAVGVLWGWKSALWFPIPLFLLLLIALFFVMGLYLLMLKTFSISKFKEALNYFQIVFTILIFACVYLLPRALSPADADTFNIMDYPWAAYTPSYWLASTWSTLIHLKGLPNSFLLSVLAFLFPFFSLLVIVKYFAPDFIKKIGGLDSVESTQNSNKEGTSKMLVFFQKSMNKSQEGQAGFSLAWLQTARSRQFKMKVLPMLAYVPIYFAYILLMSKKPLAEVWHDLPQSNTYFVLLYMSGIALLQIVSYLVYTDQYKAAWIFYATPLQVPGRVMGGGFKALWIKYFFPFFLLISLFVFYKWGLGKVMDALLALSNITFFALCIMRVSYRSLPFSQIEQIKGNGMKSLKTIILMLIPALLGFFHYLAADLLWLKGIFLLLSLMALWMVWDSYSLSPWETVAESAIE